MSILPYLKYYPKKEAGVDNIYEVGDRIRSLETINGVEGRTGTIIAVSKDQIGVHFDDTDITCASWFSYPTYKIEFGKDRVITDILKDL